jgi:DNA polymerase
MDNSSGAKHRASLWLRSEQAFGLDAVASARPQSAPQSHAAAPPPPPSPLPSLSPSGTQSTSNDLFVGPPPQGSGLAIDPAAAAFAAPPMSRPEKLALLAAMDQQEVKPCVKCRLCETRNNTVFGEGDPDAKILFIGEGPGETEDKQGRPFVGRAGELLNKMIAGMGLKREQVFIANIVKCRPPANREPAADEVAACTPYLVRQIEIIRPKVIITLGRPSSQYMLQTKLSMGRLRGQWQSWRGIRLMPTYHPAYLLRAYTEENRRAVWSDLQQVMSELKMPSPNKSRP